MFNLHLFLYNLVYTFKYVSQFFTVHSKVDLLYRLKIICNACSSKQAQTVWFFNKYGAINFNLFSALYLRNVLRRCVKQNILENKLNFWNI